MLSKLKWWFRLRFDKRIREAAKRCRADKGYLSQYDHEGLRDGDHWALRDGRTKLVPVPVEPRRSWRPMFWD